GSEKRAEDSTKRAGTKLEQEVAKKQKIDNDQEEAEMKKLIKVVPDEEEVAIDAIPLPLSLHALYSTFIHMLRNFDREELETLWKLSTLSKVAIYAYLYAGKEKGRIIGIKSFIKLFGITTALIKVSAAQEESTARVKLVLLVENEENILSSYYCLYIVNAAGSGKSYDPPINPNDQQNDSTTPINFDSEDKDEESTPQPKSQTPKPVKETPIPKPYNLKIPYPQRLRKEKSEAQYGKFLNMIRAIRINVPIVDVLAEMPSYRKFLKELLSNKHKHPIGITENMLIEVGKFTFPMDFVIIEMEEDIIDEILEEDFDALLDEGSEILHSIEGTILKEKLFAEFDKFMAMNIKGNSKSKSDTKEPPIEKITFNIDYKIKTSLEEPPLNLELKPLPDNLEYVFLEEPSFLLVIIYSELPEQNKNKLIYVLKRHKQAFAWKTTDVLGICQSFCKHKIQLLEGKKAVVQKQRRLNPNIQEVVKKEIVKLLDTGIIYPIADNPWVSPIHWVPKKGGITVVINEKYELVPTRTVMGWRVCIDYCKLNEATAKDHFPLPFMEEMLERLAGNKYFYFLDGFPRYF
ncbi:hypothetical protein Tco_0510481, partial [Tanacetum coccineum]